MTNLEIDQRVAKIGAQLRALVDELYATNPQIEQSVALGSLSACLMVLDVLTGERQLTRGIEVLVIGVDRGEHDA